ncbi:MAG: protein translocase subunit SecF [Oscillospiraceae bacterium]|nr:protein translocase subunit SecF [Oscillospiraceae bacterium]
MKSKFNFDFIKNSKTYYTISLVIIIAGIILSFVMGVKLDIEFSGGTIMTFVYDNEISSADFEKSFEDALGGMDVTVTTGTEFTTGKNKFQVEITSKEGLNSDRQFELTEALSAQYAENNLELIQSSDVSPTSGKEFFLKCLVAVIFSSIVLIIYIAVRFKNIGGWRAGLSGIIALFHDIFVVYTVFVVCGMDIDANFMAVVLTILGYSINDTIVIYDRIRENQILNGKKNKMPLAELTNLSVNQSLTRSFNTSITTCITMLTVTIVAMVYGVDSIISFSFPVMIGMISGTYSSVCLAGPIWVKLEEMRKDTKKTK